jgi:ABC-type molybdate transport system ATPase subunit
LLVPTHTLLIPDETRTRLAEYLVALQSGRVSAGERLKDNLADIELATLTDADLIDALLNTKPPQIFAQMTRDRNNQNLICPCSTRPHPCSK